MALADWYILALVCLAGAASPGPSWILLINSVLKEDKNPEKIDEKYEINKKHNLYICGKSLMYVIGTTIDYKEDLMGSRFDFTNDKIMGKCGCGVSVNF